MSTNNYITNYRKLTELLLYTLSRFDNGLNETKLMKLLYFVDADNFQDNGKTISNVVYYKNHFGPTPNYKILKGVYEALDPYIERKVTRSNSYKSSVIKLKNRDYKFKSLSAREMEAIEGTIDKYGNLDVSQIVSLAHLDPPYLASDKATKIDFSMVSFRKTDEDYQTEFDTDTQEKIASDITLDSRRKLLKYAGAQS